MANADHKEEWTELNTDESTGQLFEDTEPYEPLNWLPVLTADGKADTGLLEAEDGETHWLIYSMEVTA
jgi:hypothetical protein